MAKRLGRVVDRALEATIVGSYSSTGFSVRSRLENWSRPNADLSGRRAVVTGGSGGIGRAIAEGLMELGAEVIVTSRSASVATSAAESLNRLQIGGSAFPMVVDTGELDSVTALAAEIARRGPLDYLIHNAGALIGTHGTNSDGLEQTVASHLVGPYLLTTLLRPSLSADAHVLWMSSGGMYTQGLVVADLVMSEENYRGAVAYARAKRAMVELVVFLAPQWAPRVKMSAMHPGWVDTPGVSSGLPVFGKLMGPALRTPTQGADTMVWLVAQTAAVDSGGFWMDRHERSTAYLPMTRCETTERAALVEWLDSQVQGR